MPPSLRTILPLITLLAAAAPARATPANKAAFERHFDRFLPKSLAACTTCHLPSDNKNPETIDDFPHNEFGKALHKAGRLLLADGKRRDMESRLNRIATEDADHDGADNQAEILLGRHPGDAADKPTPAEFESLAAKREPFAAFMKSYRWRPFDPATRPAIPQRTTDNGPRTNPIDFFIAEQHDRIGLKPVKE